MPEFADYDPAGKGVDPQTTAVVRTFASADAQRCAEMMAEREGWDIDRSLAAVTRWETADKQEVLVAEVDGVVQGYAKSVWLDPQGGDAPTGWYLAGVVVAPGARRRGLASALTTHRIERLSAVAQDIWYFVNDRNRASIALHEPYGFVLHTRDLDIPGVEFSGGSGVLYKLDLRP